MARVHLWAEVPDDVRIHYEVEPGGGGVLFKIGKDVELTATTRGLAAIAEHAAEAVKLADEISADMRKHRTRPPVR